MSEWNWVSTESLSPNSEPNQTNNFFFLQYNYSRQSPNSFDTKPSTNSYQRFSHSDSALLFSMPVRVEN